MARRAGAPLLLALLPALVAAVVRPDGHPVHDISVTLTPGRVPVWEAATGLPSSLRTTVNSPDTTGTAFTESFISMGVHTGTHMDAPGHFDREQYNDGGTIADISVQLLAGPALVVDARGHAKITEHVLESLRIPRSTTRLLLKTDNSEKGLMHKPEFDEGYVALSVEGATWLRDYSQVQLVGIDYLSIGAYPESTRVHLELFRRPTAIIPVEGLDLAEVEPGWYTLACLPVKLHMAEGAPARCVLIDNYDRSVPYNKGQPVLSAFRQDAAGTGEEEEDEDTYRDDDPDHGTAHTHSHGDGSGSCGHDHGDGGHDHHHHEHEHYDDEAMEDSDGGFWESASSWDDEHAHGGEPHSGSCGHDHGDGGHHHHHHHEHDVPADFKQQVGEALLKQDHYIYDPDKWDNYIDLDDDDDDESYWAGVDLDFDDDDDDDEEGGCSLDDIDYD